MPYARITIVVAVLALAAVAYGQERIGSGEIPTTYRAGWTFTPTFGVAETYDDNISLFGRGTAEGVNDDFITTYFPEADLHYIGKHTSFGLGYHGSFLDYSTFAALNRWDQSGRIEIRREESARLKWNAHGNAAVRPETDLINLGGIPFRHVGTKTADGRGGIAYRLGGRDEITGSGGYQVIQFEEPIDPRQALFLRGGRIFETTGTWRHKIDPRIAVGADYSYRRALVVGDIDYFNLHNYEAAVEYELSPTWALSGAGGISYMQQTATFPSRTGPAYRVALQHGRAGTSFHVTYVRSIIPSFGFGGTVDNQEIGTGFRTQLFHSRHFYTDNSVVFRDDQPLTSLGLQLPLRSFRAYSVFGWQPQPYVRIEGFYARTSQSSLRAGGLIDRNRIGVQIVTSKPVRMR
jgi:hypothetical protein